MHRKRIRGLTPIGVRTMLAVGAAAVLLAAPAFVMAGGGGGNLKSRMTGNQVVPHGDGAPNGKGRAKFKVRVAKRKFCFEMNFRRTGGPVRGYIFPGRKGDEPPNPRNPTLTLFGTAESSPEAGCERSVAKAKLQRIKANPKRFHVVLVNNRYDNGAIRGQLRVR